MHRCCYKCAKDWASHTVTNGGRTEYFCCKCYVEAGNPPSDWHPKCVAAHQALADTSSSNDKGAKR